MGDDARVAKAGSGGMPLELSAGNLSQYFFNIDFVKKAGALNPSRRSQVHQRVLPTLNLGGGAAALEEVAPHPKGPQMSLQREVS